jgi:hypothetical protein
VRFCISFPAVRGMRRRPSSRFNVLTIKASLYTQHSTLFRFTFNQRLIPNPGLLAEVKFIPLAAAVVVCP